MSAEGTNALVTYTSELVVRRLVESGLCELKPGVTLSDKPEHEENPTIEALFRTIHKMCQRSREPEKYRSGCATTRDTTCVSHNAPTPFYGQVRGP